jgi:hypothetical protein
MLQRPRKRGAATCVRHNYLILKKFFLDPERVRSLHFDFGQSAVVWPAEIARIAAKTSNSW